MTKFTPEELNVLFWSKVAITADDNLCWLWTGKIEKNTKYGRVSRNNKSLSAHRVAWMYPNYVIPEGMEVCHSCDVRNCCNPKHLFLGTHQENMDDMKKKGRDIKLSGEGHPSHKLTDLQISDICRRYAVGGISRNQLAREYGVSKAAIQGYVEGTRRNRV